MRNVVLSLTTLVLIGAACAPDDASVTVDLVTDYLAPSHFGVVFVAIGPSDSEVPHEEKLHRPVPGTDYGAGVRVAEFLAVPLGRTTIRVRLESLEGLLIAEEAVHLELTESFAASVVISSRCLTGEEDECRCTSDADCAEDGADCLVGRCVSGRCVAIRDASLCGPDELCTEHGACAYDGPCATACDRPECAGELCNDAEACTHGDQCEAGVCAGASIACESTVCTVSVCDGTDTCNTTPLARGVPCPDDDNPCTADECDGAGECVHDPVPDGVAWGRWLALEYCCDGQPEVLIGNPLHCGQCGARCTAGQSCGSQAVSGAPACTCTGGAACPHGGVCFAEICACTADTQCGPTAQCDARNFCSHYEP